MMKYILVVTFICMNLMGCSAQVADSLSAYNDCAAIYFNGAMLVDDYSPRGHCSLSHKRKGELTLFTVSLSEDRSTKVLGLPFRVVIRNKRTSTYWLYTKEPVFNIRLEAILAECEQGDEIVFITDDKQYSLPHPIIEIDWGKE